MDSGLIALGAAVVGVAGTLLATVLSQRMLARVQAAQFDREQQVERTRWLREQELAELARRRECYAAANAAYRRYRIGLMSFLWLVHRSQVTPEERAVLEEVRNVHHTVFAEAQMIASEAVLAQLDIMTRGMAGAYARTMRLAEGSPHPDGSFEEIHTRLTELTTRADVMRGVMRTDLGVDAAPVTGPPSPPAVPPSP
ncbi:hypothetical protein OHA37_25135 [Streptomyces sp. NBC_00335]|uniref:hypothetical protein n=1 Tax=unclassified Streptomyces TaxID=2593676 RepID=UPI00224DB95F|nr:MULTISPECIES: hypothetical protein [unclassified Streptomyces]MCX5407138.1 hypothetical protein [Streptomyces sp. NBC_00086]